MKDNISNSFTNFYSILELSNYSTYDVIKSKYKELVKIHHPDKGGDAYTFDKILLAYEFLKDEKRKSDFDRKLKYNLDLFDKAEELILTNSEIIGDTYVYQCGQCFSSNKVENIKINLPDKNSILIVKCDYCSIAYKLIK